VKSHSQKNKYPRSGKSFTHQFDSKTSMKKNVAILFSDFGPYHVARIEALAEALKTQGDDLYAYRFSESSTIYGWKPVVPTNAKVITLGTGEPTGVMKSIKLASNFGKSLRQQKIKTAFLISYSPLPNLLCIFTAKLAGCKIVMMNESWRLTESASFFGKLVKHVAVRMFNSALVGGHPHKQYAIDYGMNPSRVFLGYDVVDGRYFEVQAARWKNEAADNLPVANLPSRYFLNLGRFVTKKNIPSLIKAYAGLMEHYPALDISLVLVGEGNEEKAIRQLAADLKIPTREGLTQANNSGNKAEIVFYPFQQVDITPLFFSRCEAFILPSMYEEWGLVVNEAMACSSAVIVSENVGCAADLVINDVNGFQFNPTSVEQLKGILEKFVKDTALSKRLGAEGCKHIRKWGPEKFAEGGMAAIAATGS